MWEFPRPLPFPSLGFLRFGPMNVERLLGMVDAQLSFASFSFFKKACSFRQVRPFRKS